MLRFIGNDKYLLDRLSLWRFGVQDKSSETRVRIPYYRNLDQLNPLVPLRRTERHLLRQCLSGLTRYDAVQGKIVPDIAHYWAHNEDFTRWKFRPEIHCPLCRWQRTGRQCRSALPARHPADDAV